MLRIGAEFNSDLAASNVADRKELRRAVQNAGRLPAEGSRNEEVILSKKRELVIAGSRSLSGMAGLSGRGPS